MRKALTPQIRAKRPSYQSSQQQRNRKGWKTPRAAEISEQSGNGIDQYEQRGYGSDGFRPRPSHQQEHWGKENSAPSAGQARQQAQSCPDRKRRLQRWLAGDVVVAAVYEKARRGQQKHNSNQHLEDVRGQVEIAPYKRQRDGQHGKGPKQFPREVSRSPELPGGDRGHQDIQHERRRFDRRRRKPEQCH